MRFGRTEQAEGIGNVILRNASHLAPIIDCNRETLISFKSAQIVNTSKAPQHSKGLRIPSQGIEDSVVGETDNRSGIIYGDGAAVISAWESAQVREVAISPPKRMLCEFRGTPQWVWVEQVGVRGRGRCTAHHIALVVGQGDALTNANAWT